MSLLSKILDSIYPIGLPIAMSLTGYNAFLTGLIVLMKRKDKAGFYYFVVSFMIFLWGVGTSFQLNNLLPVDTGENWTRFSQTAAIFIPSTWLHFVLVYTGFIDKFKKILFGFYILTIFIIPFSSTPYYLAGFRSMVGIDHYPIPGQLYYLHFLSFCVSVSFSFFIFYQAIQKERIKEKKFDLKLVCFASLYGFIMGGLSFLPVFGVSLPQYNLLLMPVWQILLTYAMIRYRAFDLVQIAEAAQRDKLAAIGTLAASMNHEIKNPLFIIRGLTETQLTKFEEAGYKDSAEIIEKSNDTLRRIHEHTLRAMDIMKRFSSFAKQSGNFEPNKSVLQLNNVLAGVMPLVRHELELEKVEFVLDIPEKLSHINLDMRDGEEIFFNLIVNAVQAIKNNRMQEPGVRTQYKIKNQDSGNKAREGKIEIRAYQENGYVNVWVNDNGPGVPQNKLKQIFDPFYTTKTEGTGLGLYITRQLVERNEGKIEAKSKIGQGTTFKLRFQQVNVRVILEPYIEGGKKELCKVAPVKAF